MYKPFQQMSSMARTFHRARRSYFVLIVLGVTAFISLCYKQKADMDSDMSRTWTTAFVW